MFSDNSVKILIFVHTRTALFHFNVTCLVFWLWVDVVKCYNLCSSVSPQVSFREWETCGTRLSKWYWLRLNIPSHCCISCFCMHWIMSDIIICSMGQLSEYRLNTLKYQNTNQLYSQIPERNSHILLLMHSLPQEKRKHYEHFMS